MNPVCSNDLVKPQLRGQTIRLLRKLRRRYLVLRGAKRRAALLLGSLSVVFRIICVTGTRFLSANAVYQFLPRKRSQWRHASMSHRQTSSKPSNSNISNRLSTPRLDTAGFRDDPAYTFGIKFTSTHPRAIKIFTAVSTMKTASTGPNFGPRRRLEKNA